MSTVAVTRVVRAPLARVWAIYTDLSAYADWLSTVDDVRVLTSGPFSTGTMWRESRTMPDGTRVTEDFRVEECTPPTRFVVSSPGVGAHYRLTYSFAPAGTDTEVSVVQESRVDGSAGRLLAFVLGGLAARVVEGALRRDLNDLATIADPAR